MLNLLLGTPVFLFLYTKPVRDKCCFRDRMAAAQTDRQTYMENLRLLNILAVCTSLKKSSFNPNKMTTIRRSCTTGVIVSSVRVLESGGVYMEGYTRREAESGELLLFI